MPNLKDKTEFGYYVVAFIDLLGQSDALREFQRLPDANNPDEMQKFISKVKETFGLMHGFHDSFSKFFSGYSHRSEEFPLTDEQRKLYNQLGSNEIKLQRFSDGLLVSLSLQGGLNKAHMRGVSGILYSCGAMFIIWLAQGHPMRAGIDIGVAAEIYENELYGAALANAHQLENEVAQYPRIVIGDGLVDYFNSVEQSAKDDIATKSNKLMVAEAKNMIAIDDDGHPIVDYLGEVFRERFNSPEMIKAVFDAYKFVLSQSAKWQHERNVKLAFRYANLRHYFDARLHLWGEPQP
jgi:hypothetical protein